MEWGMLLRTHHQRRGIQMYPQPLVNLWSPNWHPDCHGVGNNDRLEYPLLSGEKTKHKVYNGKVSPTVGKNPLYPEDHRVVFVPLDTRSATPRARYCGMVTHKGMPVGQLQLCRATYVYD